MDLRHQHGSEIYVVRACYFDDATDLLAVAGDHTVEVLQFSTTSAIPIASFHVGCRVTALAWSSRSISPSSGDEWTIELAAAGADFGLHLLTKSSTSIESIFRFGGGITGHHGKVTDMSFCGGRGEDSARYVASVSDDKMLMVWDLHPALDIMSGGLPTPSPPFDGAQSSSSHPRPQPTAYVINFAHPLTTVSSHPSTSKEFLVSDCRGSLFLADWRSDQDESAEDSWRHSNVVELVEPRALSDVTMGLASQWSGSASWRIDNVNMIGATYGSKFGIWDLSKLNGGKPCVSGVSFPEGGHRFRWCPTLPDYFATSTQSPTKGAVIHVHNAGFDPNVINIAPRPQRVRDFDFLATRGIPRIAAAVGREVILFAIGVD